MTRAVVIVALLVAACGGVVTPPEAGTTDAATEAQEIHGGSDAPSWTSCFEPPDSGVLCAKYTCEFQCGDAADCSTCPAGCAIYHDGVDGAAAVGTCEPR